jgi:hypothetical protein
MSNFSCEIYPAGEGALKYRPGDFILTHHTTIPAKLIRIGQSIRYHGRLKPYSYWNHTAIIIDEDGSLIEAVGRGVSYGHIRDYEEVEYYLVHTKLNKQSQTQAVEAAKSFLNDAYGWFTILSLTVELLTGIKIQVTQSNTAICSTVVAMSLWAAGFIFDSNPMQMMPADLAASFGVKHKS